MSKSKYEYIAEKASNPLDQCSHMAIWNDSNRDNMFTKAEFLATNILNMFYTPYGVNVLCAWNKSAPGDMKVKRSDIISTLGINSGNSGIYLVAVCIWNILNPSDKFTKEEIVKASDRIMVINWNSFNPNDAVVSMPDPDVDDNTMTVRTISMLALLNSANK